VLADVMKCKVGGDNDTNKMRCMIVGRLGLGVGSH
jgi:hypothetical protein